MPPGSVQVFSRTEENAMVTIPYIDALMADIASITKKLTPKVAVSIWGCERA